MRLLLCLALLVALGVAQQKTAPKGLYAWLAHLFTDRAAGYEFVTCGTALKLAHVASGARLHSHEVKFGSGGGSSGRNVRRCS